LAWQMGTLHRVERGFSTAIDMMDGTYCCSVVYPPLMHRIFPGHRPNPGQMGIGRLSSIVHFKTSAKHPTRSTRITYTRCPN
jgi:hypothetical protein